MTCYLCASDLHLGHHGGCEILTMSNRRLLEYLGKVEGARHAASRPEPATPMGEAPTQPVAAAAPSRITVTYPAGHYPAGYLTGSGVLA